MKRSMKSTSGRERNALDDDDEGTSTDEEYRSNTEDEDDGSGERTLE